MPPKRASVGRAIIFHLIADDYRYRTTTANTTTTVTDKTGATETLIGRVSYIFHLIADDHRYQTTTANATTAATETTRATETRIGRVSYIFPKRYYLGVLKSIV